MQREAVLGARPGLFGSVFGYVNLGKRAARISIRLDVVECPPEGAFSRRADLPVQFQG